MKNLRLTFGIGLGAVALAFTSCTYDPYYSSSSVGGSYSSGYGQGYGYGGSSFNTSLFVGTGNPRWGYDPSCYSYYDYSSRRYYDPYLSGYYPIGYRPPVVYGVPHPHGWRPGRSYCPPPRRVSSVNIVNYRNRESAYRNSDFSWSRQVRGQEQRQSRPNGYGQERPNWDRSDREQGRQNEMQSRPNRFNNGSVGDEAPSRFNNPVNAFERPQRGFENSAIRRKRQDNNSFGDSREGQGSGRGQSFERQERQRPSREMREAPQAQPERQAQPEPQPPQQQQQQQQQPEPRQEQPRRQRPDSGESRSEQRENFRERVREELR